LKISHYYWWSLSVPKGGNLASENEDAMHPELGFGEGKFNSGQPLKFVLADGATQTSFSGLWAQNIVEIFPKYSITKPNFFLAISEAQDAWQKSIKSMELPWHAEEKVKKGAFATIIWVEINNDPLINGGTITWKALSVGDSCLFLLRNHFTFLTFPIQDHNEFRNNPVIIPSRKEHLQSLDGNIKKAYGTLRQNDQIVLASDALAEWILKNCSNNPGVIKSFLESIKSPNAMNNFSTRISLMRKNREIKNDDTSIILIEVG
jgi:serine/threonine protein phosphatase PrpC